MKRIVGALLLGAAAMLGMALARELKDEPVVLYLRMNGIVPPASR